MSNLIDRQAAIIQLSHNKNKGDDEWELAVESDIQTIWKLPSAEPKRGKWVDDGDPLMLTCGNCGYGVMRYNNTPFCPNCGADMREGGENE